MNRKLSVLYAAGALLMAVPASAQNAGHLELGLGGGAIWFDKEHELHDPGVGPGARLGIFFAKGFSIEADAFWFTTEPEGDTLTGNEVDVIPIRGRLTWNPQLSEAVGFVLGGGYTYNMYSGDTDVAPFSDDTDGGPHGLLGLRFGTGGAVHVRFDAIADFISSSAVEGYAGAEGSRVDWTADAMLTFMIGKRPPKDADGDGVVNKADLCPNTPVGDAVDANGCSLPKDADGDGVTDDRDQCANTPAGAKVDANGCSDQDNDTVMDPSDRCPNTPAGVKVDANGCPTDQDKDGVFDGVDQCADTPAGTPVDARGCPTDSDGDGVMDNADRCPNTPAGTTVDASGCPALFQPGQTTLVLQGVTFATNKADLTPESKEILDRMAERFHGLMVPGAVVKVEVAGHTDNVGSRAYNTRLSQARAESVKAYLVSKGVPADILTAKGYGEDRPVDSNATVEGRSNNRRVELRRTQ